MNPQAPDFGIQRNSLDYFGIALECFQSNFDLKMLKKFGAEMLWIRGVERMNIWQFEITKRHEIANHLLN
jgi:hypothetical protein